MSIRCINYTLLPSGCPCVLNYAAAGGVPGSINLEGAKTVAFADNSGGFHIYGQGGQGLRVGPGSNFLKEDVDALICECSNAGPGSSPDSPAFADISPSFVSCASVVAEALPVRIICDDSVSGVQLACSEDGQIIFIDTSVAPPTVTFPDGSSYTGEIRRCESEQTHIEECFVDAAGLTVTRVTCWEVRDVNTAQMFWLLQDGTVTDIEPPNLIRCDQVDDCDPFVKGNTYDLFSNDQPYNCITVDNSETNCKLTVTTSAGAFIVLPGRIGNLPFTCNLAPELTVVADSAECDLSKVVVTVQRTE